jgi:hypothetical protein
MADLTNLTTNFFPTPSESYDDNLSSGIAALATTVPVNSAAEYEEGEVVSLTVDPNTAKEATFVGVRSGNAFINCVWTEGNLGTSHDNGAVIADYVSASHLAAVSKGITQEHKQNGQHENINADSLTVTGQTTLGEVDATDLHITGNATVDGNWIPNVTTVASQATITPTSTTGAFIVTALATNLTIAPPSGAPHNTKELLIRIKDNGTSRTITWNAIYRAIGVTLPTATTANKELYVGMRYNAEATKWDVLAVGREA